MEDLTEITIKFNSISYHPFQHQRRHLGQIVPRYYQASFRLWRKEGTSIIIVQLTKFGFTEFQFMKIYDSIPFLLISRHFRGNCELQSTGPGKRILLRDEWLLQNVKWETEKEEITEILIHLIYSHTIYYRGWDKLPQDVIRYPQAKEREPLSNMIWQQS